MLSFKDLQTSIGMTLPRLLVCITFITDIFSDGAIGDVKIRHPVRSAKDKHKTGWLVVESVTISESQLRYLSFGFLQFGGASRYGE